MATQTETTLKMFHAPDGHMALKHNRNSQGIFFRSARTGAPANALLTACDYGDHQGRVWQIWPSP
jgi:hypothetical protein